MGSTDFSDPCGLFQRLDSLPENLKKDMEVLWKDTNSEKKDGGLWVREEIKRSRFGGSINIVDYWATAIRLSKPFLLVVDHPNEIRPAKFKVGGTGGESFGSSGASGGGSGEGCSAGGGSF
ncbi:hypothetical protein AgCh_017880 [Apium graveolens]